LKTPLELGLIIVGPITSHIKVNNNPMYYDLKNQEKTLKSLSLSKIVHWFVLTLCLGLFSYTITSPTQNWDMLGYAASVVSIENTDKDYIHQYIYQQYKAYATSEEFSELTETSSYRKTMFSDADAFNQQIPYYKIRIILVLLILALVKLGVNIFVASHILTAALTCLGVLVFYYAYRKIIVPAFWFLIPIFLIIFDVHEVASMVSADSLAFLWVGLICYTFIHSKWKVFFLLLASSVLVRTDMIFLIGLLSVYLIIFKHDLRILTFTTLIASIGIYLFINDYANNYGWSTVFYYAVVSKMSATHPLEYSSFGITIEQYVSAVKNNLEEFINKAFLLFAVVVSAQFIIYMKDVKNKYSILSISKDILNNPILVLTLISVFYVIIHYALFPLLFERFFIGQYMIGALGLLVVISSIYRSKNSY